MTDGSKRLILLSRRHTQIDHTPPPNDGDLYVLLAQKAMELGDTELALDSLEKAIGYDVEEKEKLIASGFKIKSPFLSSVGDRLGDRYQNLDEIMASECFAPIRDNERYKKLLVAVEAFKARMK